MNKIINGDAIKVMQGLIEEGIKVDCIITDVPYNLVQKMGGSIHLFRQSAQQGADNLTKKNMFFDHGFDQISWLKKACELLKPGGNIILFNDWENMGIISQELRANKVKVKSLNFWQKVNPVCAEWQRRFVSGREYFLYATKKGALHTFNTEYPHMGDIRLPLTPVSEKKYGKHPNMKPLQLMKELIKIVTNEGDTVLDPFCGSNSTGIAAEMLGRNSIGIELDRKFYEIAKNRMDNINNFNVKDYDYRTDYLKKSII